MKNRIILVLLIVVLLASVLGCGGKQLKGYLVSTDIQEMVVWSTTEPKLTQTGWADQEAEPPIPSWLVLSQGEVGEKYFNTIAGQNPQVEKFHPTQTPTP